MKSSKYLVAVSLALASLASFAQTDVNVSIGGVIQPGVYGRVEIGTRPPPPVYYPQPVVIVKQPAVVVQEPIYMHVPPGHARKWRKHCHKYNACNQPVYFVKNEYEGEHDKKGKGKGHGKHKKDD